MARADVVAEVWTALRTDVTRHADSCFVPNIAIPELERHGAELPAAIEAVVGDPEFEQARRSEWVVGWNLGHLLLVYFEQAGAHGWDTVPFLRSLRGPALHEALVAVYQLQGPMRGSARRRAMPRVLYDAWHALLGAGPDWVGDRDALSGYHAAGWLDLT
jgi:hypothetical protein